MIAPGYYDVTVHGEQQEYDPSLSALGPSVPYEETWLGARVLMVDGDDAIVEHYPVGWRNVVRRIDRVPVGSAKFVQIPVPESVPKEPAS